LYPMSWTSATIFSDGLESYMKTGMLAVVVFWLSIVGISFWWNLADEKKEHEQLAFETARAFFQQIVITRAWNSSHGGVYVSVTDSVRPNPYLDDPLRDIVTDKGVKLTKINPAYMTRQISEITTHYNGIQFHITSSNPIRPENAPAEWEKKWLKSFEEGAAEKGEFFTEGSDHSFRYMGPLTVEESCLKCHEKQGYTLGQVRGGISIIIPYLAEEKNTAMVLGHGIIAIAGVFFTLVGGTLLERKRTQLVQTNKSLEKGIEERERLITQLQDANNQIKTLTGIIPICMYCKEIRDDKGYWNRLEKFIGENSTAEFSHGICPKCMKEKHPDIDLEG
jgi:hypothetical protein